MSRREFSKKVRMAAWARCNGRCEDCTAKLRPGKYEYDHDLPDGLGGEPTLENCRVRCTNCHSTKTAKRDIPMIAKADRSKAKFIGAKKSTRPMPGSRQSPWKHKVGGGWERRDQ